MSNEAIVSNNAGPLSPEEKAKREATRAANDALLATFIPEAHKRFLAMWGSTLTEIPEAQLALPQVQQVIKKLCREIHEESLPKGEKKTRVAGNGYQQKLAALQESLQAWVGSAKKLGNTMTDEKLLDMFSFAVSNPIERTRNRKPVAEGEGESAPS